MGLVVIYSTPACPYCTKVKALFARKKVTYWDINLDEVPELRQEAYDRSGSRSVPQVFVNGEHLGGADDVLALDEERRLDVLLNATITDDGTLSYKRGTLVVRGDRNESKKPGGRSSAKPSCKCSQHVMDRPRVLSGMSKNIINVTNVTLQQLYVLGDVMRTELNLQSLSHHLVKYSSAFTGAAAVNYLAAACKLSREEAAEFCSRMVEADIMRGAASEGFKDSGAIYQFQEDCAHDALNEVRIWKGRARAAVVVAAELRRRVEALLNTHLRSDGKTIQVAAMKATTEWKAFSVATSELQKVNLEEMTSPERLAFFINTYNMMVIHGKATLGTPSSALQRNGFFTGCKYRIGGLLFSLDDIEHGILRRNRKPPSVFASPVFSSNDPRNAFMVERVNPLIHFALNCGAQSCPPIRIYQPETIDDSLLWAAKSFFESEVSVDVAKREVMVTRILMWYGSDFGPTKADIVMYIADLCEESMREALIGIVKGGKFSLKFFDYDWGTGMEDEAGSDSGLSQTKGGDDEVSFYEGLDERDTTERLAKVRAQLADLEGALGRVVEQCAALALSPDKTSATTSELSVLQREKEEAQSRLEATHWLEQALALELAHMQRLPQCLLCFRRVADVGAHAPLCTERRAGTASHTGSHDTDDTDLTEVEVCHYCGELADDYQEHKKGCSKRTQYFATLRGTDTELPSGLSDGLNDGIVIELRAKLGRQAKYYADVVEKTRKSAAEAMQQVAVQCARNAELERTLQDVRRANEQILQAGALIEQSLSRP